MRRSFSTEFKQSIVQKIMMPGGPGIMEMAEKTGVHHTSIRRWRDLYAMSPSMKASKKWTPEKKLKAIVETSSLSKEELGEYLRKHGLHSHELEEWKTSFFESQKSPGRPKKDPELKSLEKEKKSLERDLKRKDKALAEMSARIILLKKSRLLWGEPEDEE